MPVTPEPGGSLAIAILEPFDFLTPVRAVRPATEEFMVHVTPPLGRVTEQGDIQWLMARAPRPLQPGLLFRLRPAFWEDGVPVTAADFALTVHVMLHPGAPGHERSRYGLVRDVVALDDSTLYFDLLEFSRERFRDALIAPLPAHVLGPDPDPRHLYEWPVSRKPLSCGPFRVVESSTDTLVLERREDSGWPPPRLDRVIVRSLEPEIAVQQFRDGAVDVVDALPAAQAEALRGVREARLLAFVGASYLYVGWNLRDARFGDLTVRRAAAMAVDVERLCRDLTLGQGDVARGPLVPVLGLPDTSSVLPHDLKQARALLDAAGWQDHDRDGIRDRGGARLAFNLLVPENDALREQSAAAVARALRDLEIEVSVRVLVVEEFYARLQRGAFEAYLGQWFPRRGQPLEDVWHSEATDRFNYGGFNDPGVDSLLVRLRLEQPGPSEEELLAALQRRVYAQQPYLFLFQEPRFTVFAARVQGVRPTVLSTFWNLPEWWVPRAQRSPEP
ncbi:MAG TPA: ABC transporter substrate-binding protein [Candidatus Krumholzibacteria bacterium]|nr:ABC transporter substrate-binding protein [Candidatus Krumholzibacteria bacterium]